MSSSFYHFTNRAAGKSLCFVGGYVDAGGFVILNGIFTASITGNIVKFAAGAAHNKFIQTLVVVTIFYGVGSSIVRILSLYLRYVGVDTDLIGVCILAVEVLFLVVAIIFGTYYQNRIKNNDQSSTLITGIIMAVAMGVQFASASSFPQFPNTTGMTASVATSFSALSNVVLLYLSEIGLIHFYLTNDEQNSIDSEAPENKAMTKRNVYNHKKNLAFDELDKHLNPLLYFTFGCVCGVLCAEAVGIVCLMVPIGIILFLIFEIYLAKRSHYIISRENNYLGKGSCKSKVEMMCLDDDPGSFRRLSTSGCSPRKKYSVCELVESKFDYNI